MNDNNNYGVRARLEHVEEAHGRVEMAAGPCAHACARFHTTDGTFCDNCRERIGPPLSARVRDENADARRVLGARDDETTDRAAVRLLTARNADITDLRERLATALTEIDRITHERAKLTAMVAWLRERQALLGDVVRAAGDMDASAVRETSLAASLKALNAHDSEEG